MLLGQKVALTGLQVSCWLKRASLLRLDCSMLTFGVQCPCCYADSACNGYTKLTHH